MGTEHTIYPEIEGWMYDGDLLYLRETARRLGGPILEIGSFCGLSTAVLSEDGREVWCVDTFRGGEDLPERDTLAEFVGNMIRLDRKNVRVVRFSSRDFFRRFNVPRLFSMIFIDGSHKTEAVLSDLVGALITVKPGGVIILDDLYWGEGRPVLAALKQAGLPFREIPKTKMAEVSC